MNRGASTAIQALLPASAQEVCHLYELRLDTQTVYVTDWNVPITWNGNTYLAVGNLLGFSGVTETASLQVITAQVQLSGVFQDSISLILSNNYIDRRILIYKAFISAGSVVVNPITLFDGRCDAPMIEEDPTNGMCTVTLAAAQQWVDFQRIPGRHTNTAETQIYYPGDKGFEFVGSINKQIKWGAP